MSRVLLVRYPPEAVDYSDPALPPGLNAEKVRAGIDLAMQQMRDRGWQAESSLVRPDESAVPEVERHLRAAAYDCVVIAGGIRIPPRGLLLFEAVLNAVHKAAPGPQSPTTRGPKTAPKPPHAGYRRRTKSGA